MKQRYPFQLMPLPYPPNALEPHIDQKTMELHHNRHLKAYVNNLNAALADFPAYQDWPLETLLHNTQQLPDRLQTPASRNAGGVYNHQFFFESLTPGGQPPAGLLASKMIECFGSFSIFQEHFKAAALDVFGSGYVWLAADPQQRLIILQTANQDTPLPLNILPLICIDLWEHAYYLKHYNLRAEYVNSWFHVADFGRAEKKYLMAFYT